MNQLKSIIFFSVLLTLFYLCSCNEIKPNVVKAKCSDCTEYNNVMTTNKLDLNLVKSMTNRYQNDPSVSATSTKSVWISLEKLKQFVYEVENGTCKCDSQLGVRVYFAQYPGDNEWTTASAFKDDLDNPNKDDYRNKGYLQLLKNPQVDPNPYANTNTIIMVPTIKGANGFHYDFDPALPVNCLKPGYPELFGFKDTANVKNKSSWYLTNKFGTSITALSATNHGQSCPPIIPPALSCPAQGASFTQ